MTDLNKPNLTRIHAFKDDVLADHDATELSKLLKNKEIDINEVLTSTIQRAQSINPSLNAIAAEKFDSVLKQKYVLNDSFFSGIPIFIKDNLDLSGFPTQHGCTAFQSNIKSKNSKITQQILDSGFIGLGKSVLPEFGLNASTEFQQASPTRNPWQLNYSCGASSGGAAALVAAGVIPIAHANDGGGSIRIPAANCGLVGLKPTRGRLRPNESASVLPINIISDGVVTRSVRDTAHFYAEMEQQFYNPKLPKIGLMQHAAQKRLRVAVVNDSIQGQTDQETQAVVMHTAQLLANHGHHIEAFKLPIPDSFVADFSHYWGLLAFMLQHGGSGLFGHSFNAQQLDPLTLGLSQLYRKNFYRTPAFLYRLKKIQQIYRNIFQHYDVILSPVLAHVSPLLGELSPQQPFEQLFERLQNYVTFTPIQNIAGAPAISLPMGQTQQHPRPIGIQLSADLGQEALLLSLALELEQLQPFARIDQS